MRLRDVPPLVLAPGVTYDADALARARPREYPDVSRMDAARAIEELAAEGIPARWSKGGNLWALAPEGADLRPYGLRWSPKRGMWWCALGDSGGAAPCRCRARDFAA